MRLTDFGLQQHILASASWSHQSMTGHSRFDLSNGYKDPQIPASNTRKTFFQALLLLKRLCQFITPIDDTASSIWSFQWIQCRRLRQFPQIPASNTRLTGVSSTIRMTWPSQRSRWILIRCTKSMSLSSSYSSLLNRKRKSSPTHTGPKILHRIFLLYWCLIG